MKLNLFPLLRFLSFIVLFLSILMLANQAESRSSRETLKIRSVMLNQLNEKTFS